jgi:hypothetical protein
VPGSFADMPGGEVLGFIRDRLAVLADDKRRWLKASAEISQIETAPSDLQDVCVIEAAIDVIQFVISIGDEAKTKNVAPPEWVLHIAGQARAALVVSTPE